MTTRHQISVTVNGVNYQREVDARLTLADFVRHDLSLGGTHVGCEHGVCGACTILVNGASMRSCLMLAVQADGAELTTVEGLSRNGELHPVQQAFIDRHGLQCGFCTPGMIMASADLLSRNPNPSEQEIREGLEGNFCRCTGYHNIVKSVQYAAKKISEQEKVAQ